MAAEKRPEPKAIEEFQSTPRAAQFSYGAGAEPPNIAGHAAVAEPKREGPVAMLVCHGMGQQVRFETLGQLASSILTAAGRKGCTADPNGVRLMRQDDGFLARAELRWTDADHCRREVHLYEAYWAPLTEGKVTYRDTLQFLFQAAWRGMRCSRFMRPSPFLRWMFGDMKEMTIEAGTKLALIAVALLLAIEVAVIAFVGFRMAAGVKEIATISWPRMPYLHWTWASVWAVIVFGLRCVGEVLKPFLPEHARLYHPIAVGWGAWGAALWRTLVWLVLIAQAFFLRYFLIEYVGDVAAYISPFKDSKFDAIRTEIQAAGLKVGRAIYGFTGVPGVPEYSRVIVVGHSLGSVLAYDTLNALINTDLVSNAADRKRVLERTSHLVTFGSPLDKTAFLFRTQSNHPKDPLREQLAAGFQPLIVDYKYRRRLTWINLWSPKDVISGELNYYDDPGIASTDPRQVDNLVDPAGRKWFVAHVQYWAGELLADTLYGAVCKP